jgi:hypothetical protein
MTMDFTRAEEGWESRDGTYLLAAGTDPWGNRPTEPVEWVVRVHMFGVNSWTTLRAFPTWDEAQTFAAMEDSLPVFNDEGLCRWCSTEENYLKDVPTGMFGCRLCDPVRDLSTIDDLNWEDMEAFDEDPS